MVGGWFLLHGTAKEIAPDNPARTAPETEGVETFPDTVALFHAITW